MRTFCPTFPIHTNRFRWKTQFPDGIGKIIFVTPSNECKITGDRDAKVYLQLDFDKVKHKQNSHFIRQYRYCTVPGFPGELYYLPHTHGFDHCGLTLSADDVENVLDRRNIYSEAEIAKEIDDEPFRPYFHYCSSSGHNCKDHFHSRLYLQFIYLTFMYSQSLVYNLSFSRYISLNENANFPSVMP